MQIDTISIFPEIFDALNYSLIGKAQDSKIIKFAHHNLRDWTSDKHKTVDLPPYSGGAGMVLRADIIGNAVDSLLKENSAIIVPTPSGKKFTQSVAKKLSQKEHLIFICGRYEGIDNRVIEHYSKHSELYEISIGDYVVNGGEVASIAIIEAISRLLPGVIGNEKSLDDSHKTDGYIEYPQYTKPRVWKNLEVPDVLLSGDHKKIQEWKSKNLIINVNFSSNFHSFK